MSHPLHPALVHFPIACWSLATLADVASLAWGEPAWRPAGMLMAIGLATALAAMAAGFIELLKIGEDNPALPVAHQHMQWVVAAWTCYAASLFLRVRDLALDAPDAIAIGLSVVGFVSLCRAGWLGGKLVYAHAVGVKAPPPA